MLSIGAPVSLIEMYVEASPASVSRLVFYYYHEPSLTLSVGSVDSWSVFALSLFDYHETFLQFLVFSQFRVTIFEGVPVFVRQYWGFYVQSTAQIRHLSHFGV